MTVTERFDAIVSLTVGLCCDDVGDGEPLSLRDERLRSEYPNESQPDATSIEHGVD